VDADQCHDKDIEKSFDDSFFFHGTLRLSGPGRHVRPHMFVGLTRHMVHGPLKGTTGLSAAAKNPTVSAC
jgi:hypothetical protein